MNKEFTGLSKVFSFTFARYTGSKGFKNTTVIVALLLFLLPVIILACIGAFAFDEPEKEPEQGIYCGAENIFVFDNTEPAFDPNVLNSIGFEGFTEFNYELVSSQEEALSKASENARSLVLVIDKAEDMYELSVILPENSELSYEDSEGYSAFLNMNFGNVLLLKSGMTPEQLNMLYTFPETNIALPQEDIDPSEEVAFEDEEEDNFVVYIACYLNIMVLYFMVLFYGQGVANNVILEKTSKLMDFFLVTVKPAAMVLGKVFAVAVAAILQIAIWVVSLFAGLLLGAFIGGELSPVFKEIIDAFFQGFNMLSGMFSLPSIVVALMITVSGLFLYSSLASIGGSLASKPEDLASTNQIFTLVLIASFFAVLFTGGDNLITDLEIFNWIPFTAVLITPGRVLTGEVSVIEGLLSFALIMAFSVLVTYFAGRIYKMMSLYKGDPPKLNKVIEMMKNR